MANESEYWQQVNVRFPPALHKWLLHRATLKCTSLSHVLRQAAFEYVRLEDPAAHSSIVATLVDQTDDEKPEVAADGG